MHRASASHITIMIFNNKSYAPAQKKSEHGMPSPKPKNAVPWPLSAREQNEEQGIRQVITSSG